VVEISGRTVRNDAPILLLIALGSVLGVMLGFFIAMTEVQAAMYGPGRVQHRDLRHRCGCARRRLGAG
jgi:hypothetical protein